MTTVEPKSAVQQAVGENVMVEVEGETFRSRSGYSARREHGLTPNGNPVSGRWVLRDATGAWLDFDKYRHDLWERNGLRPAY